MVGVVLHQRDFVQMDILDGGPDNHQATALRGEDVDLSSSLAHIAKETFNGVGALASTHKRSTGALRPQPGFVPLRDSACCIWRVPAINWVAASFFMG
jgi:hypothetical protein